MEVKKKKKDVRRKKDANRNKDRGWKTIRWK